MKKVLLASVLSIFLGASVLFSGCGSTDLSEINKQIADLQQQITESNKIIDNLQSQIADSNQTIDNLESQIADSNQTIDNLESQIADSNQTIDNLESQIADSNQTIDNLESQIADSNQTSENLKSQITSLNQTILELQTRLNQAEQNQQELLLDLTTAQGQLLELQEQVFGKVNNYYQINDIFTYTDNGIKYFDFQVTNASFTSTLYHQIDFNFNSNIENADITNPIFDISFYLYNPIDSKSYLFENITNQNIFTISIPDDLRQGLLFVYIGNTLSVVYELSFV